MKKTLILTILLTVFASTSFAETPLCMSLDSQIFFIGKDVSLYGNDIYVGNKIQLAGNSLIRVAQSPAYNHQDVDGSVVIQLSKSPVLNQGVIADLSGTLTLSTQAKEEISTVFSKFDDLQEKQICVSKVLLTGELGSHISLFLIFNHNTKYGWQINFN